MRAPHCVRWALPVLLLAAAAAGRLEAREELTGFPLLLSKQPRSDAPLYLDVELNSAASRLLEGRLEILFRDGVEVIGRFRSGPLALTNGIQSFRMMLPAMSLRGVDAWAEASMSFVTSSRRYDLDRHQVFLPSARKRSFVICLIVPQETWNPAYHEMARSVCLEQFDPSDAPALERTFSTSTVVLSPSDLPVHPLGYCPYDVVFAVGEGFSRLREKQLAALRRWVEAGGSLCAIPRGGLKPYHVSFLNELAGGDEPALFVGRAGGLQLRNASPPSGITMLRCGIGRAVVVLSRLDPASLSASAEWRRAAAFLWKVRRRQLSAFVEHGKWRSDLQKQPQGLERHYRSASDARSGRLAFELQPIQTTPPLMDGLLPETVRVMPVGTILLTLLLFVVAVGPLDYFLLGILRRRRLTWLVFPAVSVAFAVFTVWLSNEYMGRISQSGSVLFLDLGRGGRVLRRSRYELIFAAAEREDVIRVRNGLLMQVGQRRRGSGRYYGRHYDIESGRVPLYEGRVPGDYVVTQRLSQWTPMLRRLFSFEPVEPAVELDWDGVRPSDFRSSSGRARLVAGLLGGREFGGRVFCFNGYEMLVLQGAAGGERSARSLHAGVRDFLREACMRPQVGLFSVVSQISPTGGANFEDLSLLDPTDDGQWLLVAVTQVGSDYVVYRRLYCEGS